MRNQHRMFFIILMLVAVVCLVMGDERILLAGEQQRPVIVPTTSTTHYVAGQLLIWTRKEMDEKPLLAWIKQRGDCIVAHIPEQSFYQIQLRQKNHEQEAIMAYQQHQNVMGAELNYIRQKRDVSKRLRLE